MMQDNFWTEIKPYIPLLSLYKRDKNIGSDGNKYVPHLERIINKYCWKGKKKFCFGCKVHTGMNILISHYENTPKKGRKKKL